ncbi:histidinol-phosphate aminotransferase [Suhomyces tanzawaensis NRRL Y-17324]|uniref:histidinol-phosphate transaminase n=1 Tax=Suhomyces tanzawaensis NRRL Y-17324 TaxID=984487 RepID=A0A1E4SDY3_9ASCO|nr:histidinol-phosphate aminotransferase [Suhomyces tanzawaensis NRRL Y-17324]ODV77731.1 histidinol-phosphate aminotransferase [Suhomyces tanzawaensis NRRL Y-17324]
MFDLKAIVRPNILGLQPYRCARDDFKTGILLDANENTHGPSLSSVGAEEQKLELNRYPDPHQIELKQQIVDFRNAKPNLAASGSLLTPENLCLGVGSDESIDMLLRCVCTPGKDKLLICPPTYGMYGICATVNDVELVKVPLLTPSFDVDVDAVAKQVKSDSTIKLIYLTSPGNPTGKLLDVKDVIRLLEIEWNGLVVIDEAYVDFTFLESDTHSPSVSTLVNQYPNLVVLQTLSKSFGLAGIRLGITFSSSELSYYLNSMKYPYNISSLTSNVALKATNANDGLKVMYSNVARIIEQRGILLDSLSALKYVGKNLGGLDSNFILIEILDKAGNPSNEVAKKLYETLAVSNGVVVRFRGTELNCTGGLRISVGTAEENKALVAKFEKCLNEINK